MGRERKNNDTLPNGRNKKGAPKFENWFCQIFPIDFTYPAWRSLTSPTAKDVAHICRAKHEHAARSGKKAEDGKPYFEFTATEAEKVFKISRPTFNNAMDSLLAIGFIEKVRYGGLKDGKGIAAHYRLSDKWKSWTPPQRDNTNIIKARAARKNR